MKTISLLSESELKEVRRIFGEIKPQMKDFTQKEQEEIIVNYINKLTCLQVLALSDLMDDYAYTL